MKKKAAEKSKLTALDKIVRFFAGTTSAKGPKAKGRNADLGEMYKQALDAQAKLNETPFLDPDFKKRYTEVCELYRKISSCAENTLKKLTEELSEIVRLQDRFSAGDKKSLYEMGRRIIAIIDRRYKKGLCADEDAVDLSLDLFDKLSEAAEGGDKRARVALDELRKSWERWGEAGKRMAMPPPCARPAKKPKAERSRATTAKPKGRPSRKASRARRNADR